MIIRENVSEFSTVVDDWIKKAGGHLDAFCSEFCQDISQQVIENTPVKTGFLRGSWWSSLNGKGEQVGGVDPTGSVTAARVTLTASKVKVGDQYAMRNGTAYGLRLEYGFVGEDSLGRKYNQAPRFFVRSVIDRAPEIADAAAKRVKDMK